MRANPICPICENEIPAEARSLCPRCHFELKWLNNAEEIEREKQSFTEKFYKPKENPPKDHKERELKPALSFIFHFLVGYLGGSLPWIATWWIYSHKVFSYLGIRVGLVTGFLVGFFTFVYELYYRKRYERPFASLFGSFIISVLLSSPFLFVIYWFWKLDAF